MVKIVSRRSLGMQLVYDIGVAADHNFVLADGLIAANCFNKSHSTAYGYVTFQTAFLKANYPVEYMAARRCSTISCPRRVARSWCWQMHASGSNRRQYGSWSRISQTRQLARSADSSQLE